MDWSSPLRASLNCDVTVCFAESNEHNQINIECHTSPSIVYHVFLFQQKSLGIPKYLNLDIQSMLAL